ncbi:uncharacterized protein [Diadema antillarum]|uniref:uncharacterized protein n=1 Tax=Diadema antillarum TaxID=105358 RepID=UPI003A886686
MSLDMAGACDPIMPEANQEITQLASKLSQVSNKFISQWTGDTLQQYLKQHEAQHRHFIKQAQDEIDRTQKEIGQLKEQASNNQLAVANQQSKAREIQQSIKEAQAKTEQLLFQKEQWEKQLEEETRQCQEQQELLAAQEKATKQRLQSLNMAENFFKDRMGLEFRKIDGDRLQFVFTNIDSKAHDRSFYITIKIDNKKYQVTDCCPEITDLQALVDVLNESNNLMKFVVEIRKKFKLAT